MTVRVSMRLICDRCEADFHVSGDTDAESGRYQLLLGELRRRAQVDFGWVLTTTGKDYCGACLVPPKGTT